MFVSEHDQYPTANLSTRGTEKIKEIGRLFHAASFAKNLAVQNPL